MSAEHTTQQETSDSSQHSTQQDTSDAQVQQTAASKGPSTSESRVNIQQTTSASKEPLLQVSSASGQNTEQRQPMSGKKAGKQPQGTHAPGRQTQHQEILQQHTRGPAFPLINLNENLENQFKATFTMMLDLFEKQDAEEAETLAHELLLWGNLPVLYRSYAHMVSLSLLITHHNSEIAVEDHDKFQIIESLEGVVRREWSKGG